ncbi:MAG TPA: M28 family peptidase [Gaiellaceae bacterium]
MRPTPAVERRRRARRGSVARPVNGRLYRVSFLVALIPLLLLAFASARTGVLAAPQLPPNFDGPGAAALATELATSYPNRAPGSAGALGAASWVHEQLQGFGLPVSTDTWSEQLPGGAGTARLENVWAVAHGQSPAAIVVMAHRDDTGVGPGANDNASGTGALVELARGYAAAAGAAGGPAVRPAHTIVFLSTDAGAAGGLGAVRFAQRPPFPVEAVVNLTGIAGRRAPRLLFSGDTPNTAASLLLETAARRISEQTGAAPQRATVLAQLIDLGFPFTLGGQGPFVARGIPAVTVTTGGERPGAAFGDRPKALDVAHLTQLGRAAQELVGSLDQGLELEHGTPPFVWAGGRAVRGWAIALLMIALLVPYLVAVVDLLAHTRRRRIPIAPAFRSLARRLAFWLFAGVLFAVFGLLGAWPRDPSRPPNPATAAAGDWPVLPLLLLALVLAACWLAWRGPLVPRRHVGAGELLAGNVAALVGAGVVALLILATNPYALLFCLPALHAWLWLPQVRDRPAAARWLLFAVGLVGPLLPVLSLALRFGLGFDAPWYLLELVAVGYVTPVAFAITLAGAACAAQLAVVAAGRYAPYPRAGERRARRSIRRAARRVDTGRYPAR